jgi:glycosyltransferase involved in cell wall biosynthesis
MPTRGRAAFVAQSIRYFQRQDYPALELIIVYEDESDLPAGIDDPRIRCIRMPARTSIGAKRNEAVRVAWGELIAHWDDDDWYGAQRLSRQAAPILHNLADVTGLNDMLFMARPLAEFWASSRALFRRLFVENVSGGTLVFRRSLWEHHGRYPDTSLREDADFLLKTLRGGARLCRISGRSLCIYVRHDGNTWKFKEGHYLQQAAWTLVPAPECLSDDDRDFYFPAAPGGTGDTVGAVGAVGTEGSPTPAMPLVSCIMPTADRREFVPQAIRNFLAQDYEPRELIVLDDGRDSVADLIPSHGSIRYLRLDRKSTLGAKRNMACELARGEVIAHWDDDDWMAPTWLSSQVKALRGQGADICGLDKVFFYAPDARRAWQYVYDGRTPWVCGGTLCYLREFWRSAPFADIDVGEDNAFVWSVRDKRIATNPDQHLYVARVHDRNTSPKDTWNRRWHSYPVEHVERLIR